MEESRESRVETWKMLAEIKTTVGYMLANQIAFQSIVLKDLMGIVCHLTNASPEVKELSNKMRLESFQKLVQTNVDMWSNIGKKPSEGTQPSDLGKNMSDLTIEELLKKLSNPDSETSL